MIDDVLLLTDVAGYYEARSAFYNTRQSIGQFTASFIYQNLTGPGEGGGPWNRELNPADGFVFTLQNDGPSALGALGAGIEPCREQGVFSPVFGAEGVELTS